MPQANLSFHRSAKAPGEFGENDGIGDNADNCPNTYNHDQADADGNGIGDACELDQSVALVSVASDGTQANLDSEGPSMSADRRFVTFVSYADHLVQGDTNGRQNIFVAVNPLYL